MPKSPGHSHGVKPLGITTFEVPWQIMCSFTGLVVHALQAYEVVQLFSNP